MREVRSGEPGLLPEYLLCYLALSNFVGVDTFAVHMLGFGTGALLGLVIRRKMPDCYAS